VAHQRTPLTDVGSSTESDALARSMAEAALFLNEPTEDVDTVLGRLAEVALRAVPGVEVVSISVATRGSVSTKAATDPLAQQLDQLQYDLQEGPCIDALRDPDKGEVVVDDMAHDQRWPRYGPAAASQGLRSQMGVRIFREGHSVGGLNLYASRAKAFHDGTRAAAEIFAVHAAVAMDKARTVTSLTEALATRQTIGVAVGLVMHTYTVNESAAFNYLVRVSQTTNTKLRDVAIGVVGVAADEASARSR
jgi:GAF domain-containing protein